MAKTDASQPNRKAKLLEQIEQAKAKLSALESRESVTRRKQEARGKIVFGGYAAKAVPELLDQAIRSLESKDRTPRESLDLKALQVLKAVRGDSTADQKSSAAELASLPENSGL